MKKNNDIIMQIILILISSVSFVLWSVVVTWNQTMLSERWIVDRLIFARITFFCCSLLVLVEKPIILYRYLIAILFGIWILYLITIGNFEILNVLLILFWGAWCLLLHKDQQERIARKRKWTWRLYAFGMISQKAMVIAIITAIALITSLEKTRIQCDSFITLWRFDYFNAYLPVWTSDLQTWNNETTWSTNDLLWLGKEVVVIWSTALKDIFSLLNEQKGILQNQTCSFINSQIELLKDRPQRKFAWIFLLYFFLRPIFYVLFWTSGWLQAILRYILIYFKIIRKKTYQDTIISFSL